MILVGTNWLAQLWTVCVKPYYEHSVLILTLKSKDWRN